MNEAKDLKWEDIKAGDKASFSHTITEKDVADFANLSGDKNPLHTDEAYAKSTKFGKPYELIYTEACSDRKIAREKEKKYKSGSGREFLKSLFPSSSAGRAARCEDSQLPDVNPVENGVNCGKPKTERSR